MDLRLTLSRPLGNINIAAWLKAPITWKPSRDHHTYRTHAFGRSSCHSTGSNPKVGGQESCALDTIGSSYPRFYADIFPLQIRTKHIAQATESGCSINKYSSDIELFTTRFNQQPLVYISPVPDSQALHGDALAISWEGLMLPASHTCHKSAIAVSTVPLLPPTHHSMIAQSSVVSRSTTSGRSQSTTATKMGRLLHPLSKQHHPNPRWFQLHAWYYLQTTRGRFSAASAQAILCFHQTSTKLAYNVSWRRFHRWCLKKIKP